MNDEGHLLADAFDSLARIAATLKAGQPTEALWLDVLSKAARASIRKPPILPTSQDNCVCGGRLVPSTISFDPPGLRLCCTHCNFAAQFFGADIVLEVIARRFEEKANADDLQNEPEPPWVEPA